WHESHRRFSHPEMTPCRAGQASRLPPPATGAAGRRLRSLRPSRVPNFRVRGDARRYGEARTGHRLAGAPAAGRGVQNLKHVPNPVDLQEDRIRAPHGSGWSRSWFELAKMGVGHGAPEAPAERDKGPGADDSVEEHRGDHWGACTACEDEP